MMIWGKIAEFIKQKEKKQDSLKADFAIRSGLGLRFVRELETEAKKQFVWTR